MITINIILSKALKIIEAFKKGYAMDKMFPHLWRLELKAFDESTIIRVFSSIHTEVRCAGEVWKAAWQEAETELEEESWQETQGEGESKGSKDTRQVGEQEEEVGEQDLAGHCAGWRGKSLNHKCNVFFCH